jgi:hypothetical protein
MYAFKHLPKAHLLMRFGDPEQVAIVLTQVPQL